MKSRSGRTVQGGGAKQRAEEIIAGNAEALKTLREFINFNLLLSRKAQILGLKHWPSNLLLYGPAGTGKTSLVRAVVQESGAHLVTVRSYAKDIEKTLREAFAQASSHAKSPSVIFIDEIDVLCSRQNSRREQDARVVSLLGVLMESHKSAPASSSHFVVVASTHRVDAIDPALRRPGRFDAEIEVRIPNVEERFQILKLYTKKLQLDSEVDLQTVAVSCNGYVGADLLGLCRMATYSAENRSSDVNQFDGLCTIAMDDWKHAMSVVKPSITRGITEKIPEVTWDDIGGLKDLKKKLRQAIEWPIKYSSSFSRLGISPTRGILLHGPPGCSKTTLAKAIAHVTQASFFSLSPAELYNKYVGEGEALLRDTFRRARLAAPSIIFFDDADSIGAKRGGSSSGNSRVGDKILSTLLTEMDGLEESKGVLVLAATNLVDAIDPALRRPGRFDEVLHVPLPDSEAEGTKGFSGADLANLCKRVGMIALSEDMSATAVYNRHFETVIRSVKEPPTIIIRSVKAARTKQASKGTKKLLFPAIPAIALIIYAVRKISKESSNSDQLPPRISNSDNRKSRKSASSSRKGEIIDDSYIKQQALVASMLYQHHMQNGDLLNLDRSISVKYPPPSLNKLKKLQKRSYSVSDSGSKALQLIHQDVGTEESEKKHFVLVHGGGFGAWCWYKIIALLKESKCEVEAIDLTGSGLNSCDMNSITTLAEYAKPLTDFLAKLGDDKRVILVGHDFGGACVSYAMELYSTKVSKAIFVAAAIFGHCISISIIEASSFCTIDRETFSFDCKSWFHPRFYIKTEEDFAIPLPLQEAMIKSNQPKQVFQLKGSDHSPFFSKPEALHKLLIQVSKIT
ncbi:unnamed protein product [Fraxinus pennsylvanica]|uniref:AAA+ ATPase domain-containing protein n=1 Tax=Fraxinus pennsylvanica TaxID=56036 RepID=A0AAD1YTU8_9LAMI|nr:unnamed protein product [Fraxinus pennsylvanica]